MAREKKKTKPEAKMQAVTKSKRNTKDSVFTHLFSFPEYQLELYRALHPDDLDVSEADIKTITRDCVVATHEHNDLGLLIKDRLMVFVENSISCSAGCSMTSSKNTATRSKRSERPCAFARTKIYSPNTLKNWRVRSWIS